MKLMIDTNVFLDMMQERKPHYHYSSIVLSEVLYKRVEGVIAGHVLTTIYYLLVKYRNKQFANEKTDWLLANFAIISAERPQFVHARTLPFHDFEDAIVTVLAEISNCDYIITRNIADFEHSQIPVLTPEQFVNAYVIIPVPTSEQEDLSGDSTP